MRSIKPEFWDDRKLARAVSRDARMLYIGLWNQADEHARLNGDPGWIKGRVFPFDDDVTEDGIVGLLADLEAGGWVHRYEAEGDPFIHLPKLPKHQRLEPAKVPSRLPEPPENQASSPVSESRANKSAPRADSSEPETDEFAPDPRLSMWHVACGKEHEAGQPCADKSAPTKLTKDTDPRFVEFWSVYPKRVAKNDALKALAKVLVGGTPIDVVLRGAAAYRDNPQRDPNFTAHPATWLNRGQWDDEVTVQRPPQAARPQDLYGQLSRPRSQP